MQSLKAERTIEELLALGQSRETKSRGRAARISAWLVLLALIVILQWRAGAFNAEFSAYPDEASHYMSGLLVHDYVQSRFSVPPMKFAEDFYLHHPYLAIGHWPPAFYVLEGIWMLIFSPSRISVMLLMALVTGALAITTYEALRKEVSRCLAVIAALLLICVPVIQKYTSAVMVDLLVGLLSFWAVLRLAKYLETGRWQEALQFGALSALAILTKGNGFDLVLVPPLAIIFTRRFNLLRHWAFWAPAGIVGFFCLPWTLLTLPLLTSTWEGGPSLSFTFRAFEFYGHSLWQSLAPALLVLATIGLVVRVVRPVLAKQVEAKWATVGAFLISVYVFHCVAPAGIEARFLIPIFPPLLMFAAAGAAYLADRAKLQSFVGQWGPELVMLVAALVFAREFLMPKKASYGFKQAVQLLEGQPHFNNSLVLVSSETAVGEGIFVSEVAMRGRKDTRVILRASKVLADSNWRDTSYRPLYSSSAKVLQCLDRAPIDFIVFDTAKNDRVPEHHQELLSIVTGHPERWRLLGGDPAGLSPTRRSGGVLVYEAVRATDSAQLPRSPLASIETNLGNRPFQWPISIRLACGVEPDFPVGTTSRH